MDGILSTSGDEIANPRIEYRVAMTKWVRVRWPRGPGVHPVGYAVIKEHPVGCAVIKERVCIRWGAP